MKTAKKREGLGKFERASEMANESKQAAVRLLDINAAAKVLGISGRTLWDMTDRGEIPMIRVGPKLTRWDIRDLEAYIDASRERRQKS